MEIKKSYTVARVQPRVAYVAFFQPWTETQVDLMHTVPSVEEPFHKVTSGGNPAPWPQFLSVLTGRQPLSNVERELIALPAHFEGLDIPILTHSASHKQGVFASHSTSGGLHQVQHK